jgi:hypothetical protein
MAAYIPAGSGSTTSLGDRCATWPTFWSERLCITRLRIGSPRSVAAPLLQRSPGETAGAPPSSAYLAYLSRVWK